MNERDYHDRHYGGEGGALFDTPLFRRVHDRVARDFLAATGAGRSHRVLSLGCGEGAIERRLARHVGEIVGLDVSAVAIEQAQARSAADGLPGVSFLVAEPTPGTLDGLGRFDVVAAFAFLHHLDDNGICAALVAAHKALRPGGLLYSADPSRRRLIGLFTSLVRGAYDRYHSPGERELEPASLSKAARQAGYVEVAIGYTDYFLGPLAWLAPGTPAWLGAPLEALDNAALALPIARRYASSFRMLARAG